MFLSFIELVNFSQQINFTVAILLCVYISQGGRGRGPIKWDRGTVQTRSVTTGTTRNFPTYSITILSTPGYLDALAVAGSLDGDGLLPDVFWKPTFGATTLDTHREGDSIHMEGYTITMSMFFYLPKRKK